MFNLGKWSLRPTSGGNVSGLQSGGQGLICNTREERNGHFLVLLQLLITC